MQEEKQPLDNSRRKSDVLVVLENNRNGRTKCYSTSAAALNGAKSQAEKGAREAAAVDINGKEVNSLETNSTRQQETNTVPLAPPATAAPQQQQSTIFEGETPVSFVKETLDKSSVSSGPTLLDALSCKEVILQANHHHPQRNETTI